MSRGEYGQISRGGALGTVLALKRLVDADVVTLSNGIVPIVIGKSTETKLSSIDV